MLNSDGCAGIAVSNIEWWWWWWYCCNIGIDG